MIRIHSKNTATSLVQITHNITGIFIRNGNLHGDDRLKKYRRSLHKALLEGKDRCHLKCHLRRIYRMIRSIIKGCFHTNYRICSQRAFQDTFLKSFFNCREVILRNCATYNYLLKYIRCLQITGWLKTHLNMTILSVSTGLFFMFAFYIRLLTKCLTERNLWF